MALQVQLLLLFQTRFGTPSSEQLRGWLEAIGPVASGDDGWHVSAGPEVDAPSASVTLNTGPEVLAESIAIAKELAEERDDVGAIARCDGRLEVAWDPDVGMALADVTLELSYLEETMHGIMVYLNLRELSEGSFPDGADAVSRHGSLDDAGVKQRLVGGWRLDASQSAPQAQAPLSATFSAAGDLVYSRRADGDAARMLLTYAVEEGLLVTDQPSHPAEWRSPIMIEDGRLVVCDFGGRCVFVREEAGAELDADAALYALAGFAARHGIASTKPGGQMTPFLLSERGDGRRTLTRIASIEAEKAREAAQGIAHEDAEAILCAYAADGYLVESGQKSDAIVVEASRRGRVGSLVLAQLYEPGGKAKGQLLSLPEQPSWLT